MFFAVQKPDITILNEIQAQLTNAYRFVLLNYEKRTMYINTGSFVMEEIFIAKALEHSGGYKSNHLVYGRLYLN